MVRPLLCVVTLLMLLAGGLLAADDKKPGDARRATVVRKNLVKNTLTVKFKDTGDERTIELNNQMRLLNEAGKDVKLDLFLSKLEPGEAVSVVVLKGGKVTQIRNLKKG
jgi:hypothetical protein